MHQAARYSVLDRIKIQEAYFATMTFIQNANDKLGRNFPGRQVPIRLTLKSLQDKFRYTEVAVVGRGQS